MTLLAASNYVSSLGGLGCYTQAKITSRVMIPLARRVFGENNEITLRMSYNYAEALHLDLGATLDDLREAVETLEETGRIARRVLGSAHPTVAQMERALQRARAALRARETPPPRPG